MSAHGPVFVCHASQDGHAASRAVAALESAGIRCWIAPRDVPPGAAWIDAILRAVTASRSVVLISSSNAEASPHVLRELEQAVHLKRPIVAVRIQPGVPGPIQRYLIGPSQWVTDVADLPGAVRRAESEVADLRGAVPRTGSGPVRPSPVRGRGPVSGLRLPSLLLVLWLVVGTFAAYQRGYFGSDETACAQLGTILVTVVAGPVNYFGGNPMIDCQVPQPSP